MYPKSYFIYFRGIINPKLKRSTNFVHDSVASGLVASGSQPVVKTRVTE